MSARQLFTWSLLALLLLLAWRWEGRETEHLPGVLVPESPVQTVTHTAAFSQNGFSIQPRADIHLAARVLSREPYYLDAGSKLSPVDLALGWGPMSDQAVVDRIKISQGTRWYILRWDHPAPLPDAQIMTNSANMHMIPANRTVASYLKKVRVGQLIELRGYLVDVQGENGWAWGTSLTRDDTGDGSCELFYVVSAGDFAALP